MLNLLLDEHFSPDIAEGLRKRRKDFPVTTLAEWGDGRFLGVSDHIILEEAATQKLTLVTYNRKTIPPLLKSWAEAGRSHGGAIFVDEKTIPPSDIGALIRAILALFEETAMDDWTNCVRFLRREN